MLGTYLELSVYTPDIAASVAFYETLGFRQAEVGETWTHPYAVLSDGRLHIGLHAYEFDSPSLTYVRPNLADYLPALEAEGIEFAFRKLGDEDFHEAGFVDPDGLMITMLEARTYSPPNFETDDFTLLGHFDELSLPVRSTEDSTRFWEPLGFVMTDSVDDPNPYASLTSDYLNVGFHQSGDVRKPGVSFREPDMETRIAYLEAKDFKLTGKPPGPVVLTSPEGLPFYLWTEETSDDESGED